MGTRIFYGNVSESRDVSAGPGKSSLFFLTVIRPTRVMPVESDYLEIRVKDWESTALFAVSGALALAHENREERIIF